MNLFQNPNKEFCNWKPGIEDNNLSNIESLKVCFVYLHGVLLSCSVGVDINDSLFAFQRIISSECNQICLEMKLLQLSCMVALLVLSLYIKNVETIANGTCKMSFIGIGVYHFSC